MQSVLTLSNLFGFNQQHLQAPQHANLDSPDMLLKTVVQEIERLQDAFTKTTAKLKHAEEEKGRLLQIVTRKDDRFIAVITEKDIIIQRYEQALWKMENGLEVEE
jgi:hypothetical protein